MNKSSILPLLSCCFLVACQTLGSGMAGKASYYAHQYHGRPTASGEPYNMYAMTAAHPSLPFGTLLHVTNLQNGRSVVVRVNDRGPYKAGRVVDVSLAAAEQLGLILPGTAEVRLEVVRQ
jgi:rare lipoprotein A